jgi:hypothetical protein
MAAKFFTGLPLDGPDPECVQGYGEDLLKNRTGKTVELPKSSIVDHSHRTTRAGREGMGPIQLTLSRRAGIAPVNASDCEVGPLVGFTPEKPPAEALNETRLTGVNLLASSHSGCACGRKGACSCS